MELPFKEMHCVHTPNMHSEIFGNNDALDKTNYFLSGTCGKAHSSGGGAVLGLPFTCEKPKELI